ncbi:MAG: hydroxysqualene dehydroxylase HpnE [Aquabacterium sp.]|nr:hydroxysqualene dehydroxylase HpnE [Aquabacterium sp.]
MNRSRVPALRVAVIGAGWSGLAAAIELVEGGAEVTLHEMARHPGGRARSALADGRRLDNGQHILIGAYTETLGLMRRVGVDPAHVLMRLPLAMCGPTGRGLRLPEGHPVLAFLRGVAGHRDWRWSDRLALLRTCAGWAFAGFRCDDHRTVAELCHSLPAVVRHDVIDPLCVAALNTRAEYASAQVFLRVIRDALFSAPGSADLVLPRVALDDLLPAPALRWLAQRGATLRMGHRVMAIRRHEGVWRADDEPYDAVVMACSAREAARLTQVAAAPWSKATSAFAYEPIVTVYLRDDRLRFAHPMVALPEDGQSPAQFAFDLGALGAAPGLFSFVVSGARTWVDRGLDATARAVIGQARRCFDGGFGGQDDRVLVHARAEHRATFVCSPGLRRPAWRVAPGLVAAGDYIEGPYPATLEGAVRSGLRAARQLMAGSSAAVAAAAD